MGRISYTLEKIINKLKQAGILLSQEPSVGRAAGKVEVTKQTHCLWHREYSGMRIEQVAGLKGLDFRRLIFLAGYREILLN